MLFKKQCACGIGHILKWVITLHVKSLNVGKTGFDCHWRVVFLYYQTRVTLNGWII